MLDAMTNIMIIKFSAFRNYEDAFIKSNDAMMALLVASQLTSDFLGQHPNQETLLPDLFEKVPEIKRLNRSADDAVKILAKSESYLASMAMVYVLAVHQSYMNEVVKFLEEHGYEVEGRNSKGELAAIDSENVYKAIEDCCETELDSDLIEQLAFVRRIRNRITHFGGDPGSNLRQDSKLMNLKNRQLWEKRMGRSLKKLLDQERIELTASELMGTLALSRKVAIEVQNLLAAKVDRAIWAGIIVKEYAAENPIGIKNVKQRLRRIKGYARELYHGLYLTENELEDALELYVSSIEEVVV